VLQARERRSSHLSQPSSGNRLEATRVKLVMRATWRFHRMRSPAVAVSAPRIVLLLALPLRVALLSEVGSASPRRCTILATRGDDRLVGTDGRDFLCGLGGADKIKGMGADDLIRGAGGRDLILGGSGEDRIWGGPGQDEIIGGGQYDVLRGGSRDDLLSGDEGADRIYGGGGRDFVSAPEGKDRLRGGRRADSLCAGDSVGDDDLNGGPGRDRFFADPGDQVRSVERPFSVPACG
jgi:hemolysin type calcium-binding protein